MARRSIDERVILLLLYARRWQQATETFERTLERQPGPTTAQLHVETDPRLRRARPARPRCRARDPSRRAAAGRAARPAVLRHAGAHGVPCLLRPFRRSPGAPGPGGPAQRHAARGAVVLARSGPFARRGRGGSQAGSRARHQARRPRLALARHGEGDPGRHRHGHGRRSPHDRPRRRAGRRARRRGGARASGKHPRHLHAAPARKRVAGGARIGRAHRRQPGGVRRGDAAPWFHRARRRPGARRRQREAPGGRWPVVAPAGSHGAPRRLRPSGAQHVRPVDPRQARRAAHGALALSHAVRAVGARRLAGQPVVRSGPGLRRSLGRGPRPPGRRHRRAGASPRRVPRRVAPGGPGLPGVHRHRQPGNRRAVPGDRSVGAHRRHGDRRPSRRGPVAEGQGRGDHAHARRRRRSTGPRRGRGGVFHRRRGYPTSGGSRFASRRSTVALSRCPATGSPWAKARSAR